MANNCRQCGKFLNSADGVRCSNCCNYYHRACTNLSPNARLTCKWKCRLCKEKVITNQDKGISIAAGAGDTAVDKETPITPTDSLANEIRLLRSELITVSKEMNSFRQELSKLNNNIIEFNNRMDNVEERLSLIENKSSFGYDEKVISDLRIALNVQEQINYGNDIEISGIVEQNGENVAQILKLVGRKLGTTIEDSDIVSVERSGPRVKTLSNSEEHRSRPIVVRLVRRALRDDLLRAARVRRGADSSGIVDGAARRFYVNERLTRANRHLFYLTRSEGRKKSWKYI